MIILTRQECLAAKHVIEDAAEHKELDAPSVSMLLGAIHDALENIKAMPYRVLHLDV